MAQASPSFSFSWPSLRENAWYFGTALLLFLIYSYPTVEALWKPIRWLMRWARPKDDKLPRNAATKTIKHVTIVSPLPQPPTDTTATSDETETSELTDEHHHRNHDGTTYQITEARTPRQDGSLSPAQDRFATHAPTLAQSKPVHVVGPHAQQRLADIPEAPSPALHCSLKLKNKLIRQRIACSQSGAASRSVTSSRNSICGGHCLRGSSSYSSTGSSHSNSSGNNNIINRGGVRAHRRRQSTLSGARSVPTLPSKQTSHKRYGSEGYYRNRRDPSRTDAFLLERIAREQQT